jgi:hypothetical protein
MNSKYEEIRKNILERLEEFFKGFNNLTEIYSQIQADKMSDENLNIESLRLNPINKIFKKILLGMINF